MNRNRMASIILASFISGCLLGSNAQVWSSDLKLWYKQPALEWNEALPVRSVSLTGEIIVRPVENSVALKNPLKGWRGQMAPDHTFGLDPIDALGTQPIGSPHESLRKWYASWAALEPDGTYGIDRIKKETNRNLADFPSHNMKAIPRVQFITYPSVELLPSDIPSLKKYAKDHGEDPHRSSGWYLLPEVKSRIERLIGRLGKVWDNDSRIAYVEMGIAGKYGEQWDLGKMPKVEAYLHTAFRKAFKNKRVMLRGAGTHKWTPSRKLAEAGPYGFYQDSFAVDLYEKESRDILTLDGGDRWKIAPMGGEGALKKHEQHGKKIGSLFNDAAYRSKIEFWIRRGHTNHLGSPYGDVLSQGDAKVVEHFHKLLGYRYVLESIAYTASVDPGQKLHVRLQVKNVGSSPMYYRWPIQISLVFDKSREPAWSSIMTEVDIRTWLPADGWDAETGEYNLPSKSYIAEQTFELPASLGKGEYVLAVSVPDPEGGMRPTLRFAIMNYWQGGLHPIGYVGVGMNSTSKLDRNTFFLDGIDPTLCYEAP